MAVYQWTAGSGDIVTYESDSDTVQVGQEAVRPATPEEHATAVALIAAEAEYAAYVAAGQVIEQPVVLSTRDALTSALTTLRTITADQAVTGTEAGVALTAVIPALESFRDLEVWDEEAVKLTILLLSQAVQALYIIGSQGATASVSMAQAFMDLMNRVTALENAGA